MSTDHSFYSRLLSDQLPVLLQVLHGFRLLGPEDVDADVRSWLAEAYLVGRQDHLHTNSPGDATSPNPL